MTEARQCKCPATGRNVWQCTSAGKCNIGFYFHDECWSPDAKWLYFTSMRPTEDDPDGNGYKLFRLKVPDGAPERVAGTKPVHYWMCFILSPDGHTVFEDATEGLFKIDITEGTRTQLSEFDPIFERTGLNISCDGRLLARTACTIPEKKESDFPDRETYWWSYGFMPDVRRSIIQTFDAESGPSREILRGEAWYDHVQFSPTDPKLILFSNEGNWFLTQRMWLISADGHILRQANITRMRYEGIGHEFFSADGRYLWGHGFRTDKPYESGLPRFGEFERFIFRQSIDDPRDYSEWSEEKVSRHWNRGSSEEWLVGDGTCEDEYDADAIWRAWIDPEKKRVEFEPIVSTRGNKMSDIEPNAHISPDGRWVSFTSDQFGDDAQVCVAEL